MMITNVSHLSPAELTAELGRLARCEREATAALIVHLAEFDRRRLYEAAGYPSLFKYCMAVLLLSEDAVYNRIEVARAARRYPVILEMLASGALSPTTARLLASRLTDENHEELLAAASGKGKQAVEELVAHRFPWPDVAARVRKIPSRPVALVEDLLPVGVPTPEPVVSGPPAPVVTPASPPTPRPVVRPLAPERYEIRFTASAQMRDKLRLAQDLLGHAISSGDIAQVFDRALTLLLVDLKRKKFADTPRSRRSRGRSGESEHIPAEVKRAVMARDNGRCAFVAVNGHRCGERRFIEFHHVIPRGARGLATVENIQLRCRAHNGYEVDLCYGPGKRRTRSDSVREAQASYRRVATRGTRSGTSRAPVSGETHTGGGRYQTMRST
jgi:hypothetical protein